MLFLRAYKPNNRDLTKLMKNLLGSAVGGAARVGNRPIIVSQLTERAAPAVAGAS